MKPLSARELDVARYVAQDLTDKLIGDVLGISPRTVQDYLDRIGKKIGATKGKRARRRVIARWITHHDGAHATATATAVTTTTAA